MAEQSHQLVQKLWNYCNILRDDGLSYGDYVEQLTFLLFLKMADEQSRAPFNTRSPIPKDFDWQTLLQRDGDELETHYRHVLESLGKEKGMLGVIFRKAQNKIQDPAKLRRLIVDLIDKEQWSSLSADVKGDAYEGLLQQGRKGDRLLFRCNVDRSYVRSRSCREFLEDNRAVTLTTSLIAATAASWYSTNHRTTKLFYLF